MGTIEIWWEDEIGSYSVLVPFPIGETVFSMTDEGNELLIFGG